MNEREQKINELLQKLRDGKISEEELKQLEEEIERDEREADEKGDLCRVIAIGLLRVAIGYEKYKRSQGIEDRGGGKEDAGNKILRGEEV